MITHLYIYIYIYHIDIIFISIYTLSFTWLYDLVCSAGVPAPKAAAFPVPGAFHVAKFADAWCDGFLSGPW